ncbi:leucine-rich repeat domain-containing protein [Pyxidicoccus parkwayensis]|uniref:Leucine-rich repeat domain-containing protein n=1 Tax=Pyxidicoccus parkwayensis TaxID=2813578 RepID=A0ABX7NV46_9BACT|nr:leucine-rich repeat domain-containing protein [Pyxidicoccus parkwaysis]QSQ22578.1 leucine-rich repeat domain-containing protein [Pyxidicoccus parkwaysis]
MKRAAWLGLLALVAGCDGIELDKLVKQHDALSRSAKEPAGEHCTYGGDVVRTGLDLDDDGVLADGEVKSTEYLCDSATPGVLIRVVPVSPGEKCPLGGLLSRAGLDVDGDGVLGDREVTRESLSCTETEPVLTRVSPLQLSPPPCGLGGSMVDAGPDVNRNGVLDDVERRAQTYVCIPTSNLLLRQVEEPASSACPNGGTRVLAGADVDSDGTFEDSEVTTSILACRDLRSLDATYVIRNAADVEALAGISRIRGSLVIDSTALTEVTLPTLMSVGDQLLVNGNSVLKRVEMPALRYVETSVVVMFNASLEMLVLGDNTSSPTWVAFDVDLLSNPRLSTLSGIAGLLPRRNFTLEDNDALEYPGVFSRVSDLTGNIIVQDNAGLKELPFANLQRLGGSLTVMRNPALPSLTGTQLVSIGGDLGILENDGLIDLSGLPKLELITGVLSIQSNNNLLSTKGLTALGHVGRLNMRGNPGLSTATEFPALRSISNELSISNNLQMETLGDLHLLQHVESLTLANNPRLANLTGLEQLQTAGTFRLENNAALTNLGALSRLRSLNELLLVENANLSRIDLPGLENVATFFSVVDNPKLPRCMATALATRTFTGTTPYISGNDDAATCD